MPTPPARTFPRAFTLLVVLLAAALGLVGCADASRGDGDEPRALSKREYIEESNALQREAASTFESLDGRVATTPRQAARYLGALDALAYGLEQLQPPRDWREEHATMLESVRMMRQSMAIVSRASPNNTRVIELQLERSSQAQRDYERAVREINATR